MHEFASRDEAEAARLMRELAPAIPPPAAEQRVYARLGLRRRLAPRAMRLAVVASGAVIVAAVLGTALAMSFRYVTAQQRPSATTPPHVYVSHASTELQAAAVVPPIRGRVAPEPIPANPSPYPSTPEREQAKATPLPAPLPAPIAVRRKHRGAELFADEPAQAEVRLPAVDITESTAARAAEAPAEEASLVLTGLRLLRRNHDSAQAGVLFGRYLERFPQGALAEEALALAIEASVATGEGRAAAGLAERYLARFPSGRFSRLAHKVLGARP
jgi:type IV secretory pathway VirB10-like protein